MLTAIALVLALYVLTRLLGSLAGGTTAGRILERGLAIVTIAVALFVAVDAVLVGTTARGVTARLATSEKPTSGAGTPASSAPATPTLPTVQVTKASGGSIQTPLGFGFVVAKGSSLTREWLALHDPTVPVDLDGTPGVVTTYVRENYSGSYRYQAKFVVTPRAPLSALELRFIAFDVWVITCAR